MHVANSRRVYHTFTHRDVYISALLEAGGIKINAVAYDTKLLCRMVVAK